MTASRAQVQVNGAAVLSPGDRVRILAMPHLEATVLDSVVSYPSDVFYRVGWYEGGKAVQQRFAASELEAFLSEGVYCCEMRRAFAAMPVRVSSETPGNLADYVVDPGDRAKGKPMVLGSRYCPWCGSAIDASSPRRVIQPRKAA